MLYIVSTPIGNLEDITLRALNTLKEVDLIICEDKRRTSILLSHYQISKPLFTLNDYNEARIFPQLIDRLKIGEKIALVSDAGTPLISDPGYKLVREALNFGIPVDSIPGPSSVVTALTLSSLPPDKFFFLGYLPEKEGQRIKLLTNLLEVNKLTSTTFIAFVAPHKLGRTLEDLKKVFGDIEVVLAKELTKIYQDVSKRLISDWIEEYSKKTPKGEFVLLFSLNH